MCFGVAHVDVGRLHEQLGLAASIVAQQVAHDGPCCHLHQATGVEGDVVGGVKRLNLLHSLLVGFHHLVDAGFERSNLVAVLASGILLHLSQIGASGDVANCRYHLQLGCSLIDVHDACVAIESLAGVVAHEAATAVNLDAVVGGLVGILTRRSLRQWSEGVGKAVVALHLGALLGSERALTRNLLPNLVYIYKTRCLIEDGACSVELSLDIANHLGNSREGDDCLAKLLTAAGIVDSLVVGCLAQTHALGGDTQAGTVHERHHILDEAQAARATQLGLGVLEHQLTCGTAMDTHLVLDAAHCHATVALVVDEHRQTAAILAALLAACEYQVDIAVAVGDKALHAVEAPSAILVLSGLEHHALEVATSIGLGEVHRHSLAGAHTWDIALELILVASLKEGVDTALQAPHVLEASIGLSNHLAHHRESDVGQVQATILAWHRHAIESSLAGHVKVLLSLAGIGHTAVGMMRTFLVDALGIGSDGLGSNLSGYLQNLVVGVDGIVKVDWCIVKLLALSVVALFHSHDFLHQGMTQMILQSFIVFIEICHKIF